MRAFAQLYTALDETTRTTDKVAALRAYLESAPAADAAWAAYFLIGRRPRQVIPNRQLVEWACEEAGVPGWLFLESADLVGDMSETITLLLPENEPGSDLPLHVWIEERILPLRDAAPDVRKAAVLAAWRELDVTQRMLWNKLVTGAFRVGVSQRLVLRALAQAARIEEGTVAHRMMGDWEPTPAFYTAVLAPEAPAEDARRPYPFFLAHPLAEDPSSLGDPAAWQIEWKWDGIRAQLLRREGGLFLWTRGEELVTDRYPEVADAAIALPAGTVLDGELLPWAGEAPLPFGELQRRIGRKSLTRKILEEVPVVYMAFDLLEDDGADVRKRPLQLRRGLLEHLVADTADPRIRISPLVPVADWEEAAAARTGARAMFSEGLMIKRRDSAYGVGRPRGIWWKWKIDPLTADAVLIYAQRGSGKRANLYTDYTFGIWDRTGVLVPFAKAYSGLTDEEIREVDAFVRRNTIERYGPIRVVRPELVFELGFEGIRPSNRHKSGIAVRFPRILRRRLDKTPADADSVDSVRALLPALAAGKP